MITIHTSINSFLQNFQTVVGGAIVDTCFRVVGDAPLEVRIKLNLLHWVGFLI